MRITNSKTIYQGKSNNLLKYKIFIVGLCSIGLFAFSPIWKLVERKRQKIIRSRNMNKNLCTLLLIFFLSHTETVHSQSQILVGVQLGPNFGYPMYLDKSSGNLLGISDAWGINMALVNKNGILMETGIYKYEVNYGKNIQVPGYSPDLRNNIEALQIPIRFQKRISIKKDKFFLAPSIGVSYLYHVDAFGSHSNTYVIDKNNDTVYYSMKTSQLLHKNGLLAETGIKLEFIVLKYLVLNFASYYSFGLHSLAETSLSYTEPTMNKSGEYKISTRGNNLQFYIGASFIIYDKQRKPDKK